MINTRMARVKRKAAKRQSRKVSGHADQWINELMDKRAGLSVLSSKYPFIQQSAAWKFLCAITVLW
jgi:hypothetical protein